VPPGVGFELYLVRTTGKRRKGKDERNEQELAGFHQVKV
jgi:hypothetical protein